LPQGRGAQWASWSASCGRWFRSAYRQGRAARSCRCRTTSMSGCRRWRGSAAANARSCRVFKVTVAPVAFSKAPTWAALSSRQRSREGAYDPFLGRGGNGDPAHRMAAAVTSEADDAWSWIFPSLHGGVSMTRADLSLKKDKSKILWARQRRRALACGAVAAPWWKESTDREKRRYAQQHRATQQGRRAGGDMGE